MLTLPILISATDQVEKLQQECPSPSRCKKMVADIQSFCRAETGSLNRSNKAHINYTVESSLSAKEREVGNVSFITPILTLPNLYLDKILQERNDMHKQGK